MNAKTVATSQDFMRAEASFCARNYHPVPVVVDHALDCLVWDVEGREYLDMMSAYSAVSHGHLHPRLVAAAQRQLARVAVTSRAYHGTTLGPFLEKLCRIAGFERALPMNTGAEAVETAIKAARRWGYRVKGVPDGQAEILVARGNFHGRTTTVISASSEADYRAGFGPFTPGFIFFDFGDMASVRAATSPNTCAVLVEPIQGEAGIVLPPAGFFAELRDWCTQQGMLLILDEVQSGLGRTGRWFAFEHEGIRPDALILGKALGGGLLPVSAFLADQAVMDVFTPGSHGSTFGGNALAAAVGLEALQVLEDENLVARSAALGRHLLQRLVAVQGLVAPLVRAVRGRGLWVGVDMDPAFADAREVVERLAARGVLSKETHETVIRFAPPLTISRAQIDTAVDVFAAVLLEMKGYVTPHPVAALPDVAPVAATAPQLLMSPPDFFEVSYAINPWMDPDQWSLDAHRLAQDARSGWAALKACYEALGARVEVKPAVRGLPDLVFTANCAVVLDGKVLLARYLKPERAGEEAHGRRLFEQLRLRGEVDSLHAMPAGVFFEGAGDAIFDAGRGIMWMGYGQRSSLAARDSVEQVFGIPTLSLELVDPRFYHLDTCFCLLSGGEVLYYPPAFSEAGRAQIRAVAGDQLIEAGSDDALHLGVNSVCIGRDVVMCHCSAVTRQALEARGYHVHVVPLGAFNRSGGAAYCLTLSLNNLYRGRSGAVGRVWPQAA
ncbi:ornithine--oxo-acid transaminase [Polaromonas sp. SM01]|uniref:ornithine--oxo-acid transaminase n=1 Tax=Polaromonas sp. SM01 TaxID=3085630 RepID=UPI002980C997|nr:ornithine--oxo-acid transaminase [Polaromonas sp. SM01]MDW5441414.1 ornithine--oxo-acid transaminase [Polaromonas sp. SM01]